MDDKIHDYIYSMKDEIIQDLADLVAIPSVKGIARADAPFGEEPKSALLKMREMCEDMDFKTTVYENAVLCADFCPDGEQPELGILAHLDVVPVQKENWATNPFLLAIKNDILYGRGVIDDKGPAVAVLWALNAIKDLNIPLKKGVRLIFGTDEENGSEDLKIYKKHDKFPPKVFTPDGSFPVINIEKGMVRLSFSGKAEEITFDGGSAPNAVPDKAVAVVCGRELSAEGRAAHASTPKGGINAITALIAQINQIVDNKIFKGLERLFPHGETDGDSLGLKCADESGALTCVLSRMFTDQDNINGYVDIRFPTCTNLETVKGKIFSELEKIGLDCKVILGDEPHIVPEDGEFVQELLSVYERIEGEKGRCIAIGGGTYVHNIPGGVAFGAERGDTDYHMHGDNEFITMDELLKDAVLYAHTIIEICG